MGWAGRRAEFVLGRALLRTGFGDFHADGWNWQIDKAEHGKPVLAPDQFDGLHFSLAHTEGFIGCAFSTDGLVGLDVEQLSRASTIDRVKAKVFAPSEVEALASLSAHEKQTRLLGLWTGKEAVTKALGEGLTYDFRKLKLGFESGEVQVLSDHDLTSWRLEQRVFHTEFFTALAVENPAEVEWKPLEIGDLLTA